MRSFNLHAPAFPGGGPGKRSAHVSADIGADEIGARLFDLPDADAATTYHFHHAIEEWLLVVDGTPTLRTPEGTRTLSPGDVVCFPAGPAGAHGLTGPGSVLLLSDRRSPDVVEAPDTGRVRILPSGDSFDRDGPAPVAAPHGGETVNVLDLAVEEGTRQADGYRPRSASFGPRLGAERLGATVYELDPGESICPYHFEGVEEEWLAVLTGTPTLRDPDGEHVLAAGDVVAFVAGPSGAHKVTILAAETTRLVMFSTQPKGGLSVCVYPDSAKVGVWPWPGGTPPDRAGARLLRRRDLADASRTR